MGVIVGVKVAVFVFVSVAVFVAVLVAVKSDETVQVAKGLQDGGTPPDAVTRFPW